MTYSAETTRWGTLLRRQAELQRVGGLPAPEPWQLETALLDELGELTHELKPLWVWWAKPGMGSEVNPERVLAEAADVLHFLLLRELYAEDASAEEHYRLTPLLGDPPPSAQASLVSILHALPFVAACHLCGVVARFGYTPGDLTRAYWEKTEENLRRWRDAADPAPEAPESPEPEHRCAHVPGDYERLAAHVATTRAQLAQRDAALAGAEAKLEVANGYAEMYQVTLENLRRAAAGMLAGVLVFNSLDKDAEERKADISGPVVTSLRAAVLSADAALGPNPPIGLAKEALAKAQAQEGQL